MNMDHLGYDDNGLGVLIIIVLVVSGFLVECGYKARAMSKKEPTNIPERLYHLLD